MATEGDQVGPVGWSISTERTQSCQASANESRTTAADPGPVASAFVHDLQSPAAQHLVDQRGPWIERDPVRFWQGLSLALALLVLLLVARLSGVLG